MPFSSARKWSACAFAGGGNYVGGAPYTGAPAPVAAPTPAPVSSAPAPVTRLPVANTAANWGIYTVVKGDTLASIAAKENTTIAELRILNPQFNFGAPLMAGEKLRVRSGAAPLMASSAVQAVGGTSAHPTTLAGLRTAV